jgi:hypothetical protein
MSTTKECTNSMARTRRTSSSRPASSKSKTISNEDLAYLAGMMECSLQGLKGVQSTNPIYITPVNEKPWCDEMERIYGGKSDEYVSTRGKRYWGWYVPVARRIELIKMIRDAKMYKGYDVVTIEGVLFKMERTLNSSQSGE